jgi:hypothetical protein
MGTKPLCKWNKDDIKDDWKDLKKLVAQPKFICRKCGRVCKKEENLCKPEDI